MREALALRMSDGQEVPAFFLSPADGAPRPGILVLPGHSPGIVATAGLVPDFQHGNALALARAGYAVLTIEIRGFGYPESFGRRGRRFDQRSYVGYNLAIGRTALGRTISDAVQAISYLEGRAEVEAGRIGVAGFSSGGKAAVYLSGLDPRVRAVVASGCVTSHESAFRISRHDARTVRGGGADLRGGRGGRFDRQGRHARNEARVRQRGGGTVFPATPGDQRRGRRTTLTGGRA